MGRAGCPPRTARDPWLSTATGPDGLMPFMLQRAASRVRFRRHQTWPRAQIRLQSSTEDFTLLLTEASFDDHPVSVSDRVTATWAVQDTDILFEA
jgi:hypothetical protein